MVRLSWSIQAAEDLDAIASYIAINSKAYAKIQIKRIREKAQQLKHHPYLGRVVPECNDKNIRELILGNYRIIYSTNYKNKIIILTVYHSARRLSLPAK